MTHSLSTGLRNYFSIRMQKVKHPKGGTNRLRAADLGILWLAGMAHTSLCVPGADGPAVPVHTPFPTSDFNYHCGGPSAGAQPHPGIWHLQPGPRLSGFLPDPTAFFFNLGKTKQNMMQLRTMKWYCLIICVLLENGCWQLLDISGLTIWASGEGNRMHAL